MNRTIFMQARLALCAAALLAAACTGRQEPAERPQGDAHAASAAAAKAEVRRLQNADWVRLAATMPDSFTDIQHRLDARGGATAAVRAGLRDAESLWSKAQAAFAAGNLDEAVSIAQKVRARVDALSAELPPQ